MGSPARVRREVSEDERASLRQYAVRYVGYKEDYRAAKESE
jgi:carbonic anhydrase/acetyltransferase-like protein (isoleucine patch superfamily)